jgi:transposase-like protein
MNVVSFPHGNNLLQMISRRATVHSNRSSSRLIPGHPHPCDSDCGVVDTNALVRTVVADLVANGLSQASLAREMGVSPTWLSRWLHQRGTLVLSVSAFDGLLLFLHRSDKLLTASIVTLEQASLQARHEGRTQAQDEPGHTGT